MGQPHLAPHHPPSVRHVVLDVNPLDGVGCLRIIGAEEIAQRFNGPPLDFGIAQSLRQLFER